MTEVDKNSTEGDLKEKPAVNKTMKTISRILLFVWGLGIGIVILNPFGFALTFYHYVGFALITFFIIIFYNGMTAGSKPETVQVKNYVDMK